MYAVREVWLGRNGAPEPEVLCPSQFGGDVRVVMAPSGSGHGSPRLLAMRATCCENSSAVRLVTPSAPIWVPRVSCGGQLGGVLGIDDGDCGHVRDVGDVGATA